MRNEEKPMTLAGIPRLSAPPPTTRYAAREKNVYFAGDLICRAESHEKAKLIALALNKHRLLDSPLENLDLPTTTP